MKKIIVFLTIITSTVLYSGCEFDNYDPPTSILSGNVVYNGTPVGVRSGAARLEIWQYKWESRGVIRPSKIDIEIAQDGSYSSRLFNGEYKLIRLAGAPWPPNTTDTISVSVNGDTNLDIQVTPYFVISSENFTYNQSTKQISSSCIVTKAGNLNIENLTLYVGTTNIVDANNNVLNNIIRADNLTDLTVPKTNTVTLSDVSPHYLASRKYVFVRIGVKAIGVNERYYTPVKELALGLE